MPWRGAELSSRSYRTAAQSQWVAVVRKTMPKIVESLIEAAELLGERARTLPARPTYGKAQEGEDESLVALLSRFLHAPETSGISATPAAVNTAITFDSENPLVG